MSHSIPILLYHRIDHSSLSTSTTPRVFRRHLEWLRDSGWRSLSAAEFIYYMQAGRTLPARTFVITFDGGYDCIAGNAFDVLLELGCSAICFLSTGFLRNPEYDTAPPDCPHESDAYLSWGQVRALQSTGILDFQSHTHRHTHGKFVECSSAAITQDLGMSIDVLSDELDLPRSHFSHLAWPWGMSTACWRAAASKVGFKYQYTVAEQSFSADTPRDDIPRTCFDSAAFPQFRKTLRLQSGQPFQLSDLFYSFGRKPRRTSGVPD